MLAVAFYNTTDNWQTDVGCGVHSCMINNNNNNNNTNNNLVYIIKAS